MKQFTLPVLRGLNLPEPKLLIEDLELKGNAAKPMQQIYQSMCRLAEMGEDERRTIWLRYQSDYDGVLWGELSVSTYRDFHFMRLITNGSHYYLFKWRVEPETNVDESANEFFGYTKIFNNFEKKVLPVLDSICANPDAYNAYINRYASYAQRQGNIRRSVLNQIVPEFKLKLTDLEQTTNVLKRSISGNYDKFDTMTIRQFCKYYRAADEAFFLAEHDPEVSDIEYYERHKYGALEGMNVDSEADFQKFAYDHYGEIGLSRTNVHAYKQQDGRWEITFGLGYYAHLEKFLEVATRCYQQGLYMKIWNAKKMLDVIAERDYVGFSRYTFHQHLIDDEVGNDIELDGDLYEIEDDKRRRAAQRAIIKAAEWEPLEQVSLKEA